MRAKWMGVAVAAMMACSWASSVAASEITGTFRGITADGTGQDVVVSFDLISPDFTRNQVDDVNLDFSVGNYSHSTTAIDQGSTFAIYNFYQIAQGPFTGGSGLGIAIFGGLNGSEDKGSLVFGLATKQQLDLSNARQSLTASDLAGFSGQIYLGEQQIDVTFTSLEVTGLVVNVSTVPLPASAPMFGAALLALGAIGYGAKKKAA